MFLYYEDLQECCIGQPIRKSSVSWGSSPLLFAFLPFLFFSTPIGPVPQETGSGSESPMRNFAGKCCSNHSCEEAKEIQADSEVELFATEASANPTGNWKARMALQGVHMDLGSATLT